MKYLNLFTAGIFILMISLLPSCEKLDSNPKGNVEFTFTPGEGNKKSDASNILNDSSDVYFSWHLLISVTDQNGAYILKNELIPLIRFGEEFITGKIELSAGKFLLTKFMVIGPDGNAVYAAPLEGSAKSFLVNRPLPLDFQITPGELTRVIPQVLPAEGSEPVDFGYAAFGFDVVYPLVAYVMAVDNNPLLMRPSSAVPAKLTVFTEEGMEMVYQLQAGVNKILLKQGVGIFHMLVENPSFPPLRMDVDAEILKNTLPEEPFIFDIGNGYLQKIILQPGPENGKDAMITDLDPGTNFGGYPYFEASFITEPVLTVMRKKRSLIYFDLSFLPDNARIENVKLVCQFETPVWDSLYESELDEFMIWNDHLVFRQIIEPWDESKVNWQNQPATIPANQVIVPLYPDMNSNIRTYDVTSLFIPVQEIAAPNFGFMFMYPDEEYPYPGGLKFASSDYPQKEMRPKLIISYSEGF